MNNDIDTRSDDVDSLSAGRLENIYRRDLDMLSDLVFGGQRATWSNGQVITAREADFEARTWTFDINDDTRVSAGDFLLIPLSSIQIRDPEAK